MPKVYNKRHKDVPPDAVYVGRPSPWGNPFSHLDSKLGHIVPVESREDAIQLYAEWIMSQPAVIASAKEYLKGKDLVCWCAPKACHADILVRIANDEVLG